MTDHPTSHLSDAELRLQLRGLAKERESERDLWADIHSGIQSSIQVGHAHVSNKNQWQRFAIAASLATLLVIALPMLAPSQPSAELAFKEKWVRPEVMAMDAEYHAALKEFAMMPVMSVTPELQTQLNILDDSAAKLHQALNQSPQSIYLIPMLRRTYFQRLQLIQRVQRFQRFNASNFT